MLKGRYFLAVFFVAALIPVYGDAITVNLDQTGLLLQPNQTNVALLTFVIDNTSSELLDMLSFRFNLNTTGGLEVHNLSLWSSSFMAGGPIANPGSSPIFTVPFLIPPDFQEQFRLLGDVSDAGAPGGTMQFSIPVDGLSGKTFPGLVASAGPDSLLAGPVDQLVTAPEPPSWLLAITFCAGLAAFRLKRPAVRT